MKVLHTITSMDPTLGGVCQGLRTIAGGLEDEGFSNEVVTLDEPSAEFLRQERVPIHALGRAKSRWSYNAKLSPWLTENLIRFDAVVVHGIWQFHGYATAQAVRRFKLGHQKAPRLFIFPQGMLDPYFQRAPGRRIKSIRNWVYWKLAEGPIINEADGIFFTAEMERQLAHQPFKPYHPKLEVVVGMGVHPPPTFSQSLVDTFYSKCPKAAGSAYILFLGRIDEKKGIDLLLNAYIETGEKMGWSSSFPKLVIAGPGLDSPYGKKMLHIAAACLRGSDFILFPGMLTGDAKWGAFYGAEAFALTTHQENFGIAIVEAMACGRPVLISNKTNIWSEVVSLGGGFVSDDNPESTNAMLNKWLMLSNEEKSVAGLRAEQAYNQHFAIKPTVKRWAHVLRTGAP